MAVPALPRTALARGDGPRLTASRPSTRAGAAVPSCEHICSRYDLASDGALGKGARSHPFTPWVPPSDSSLWIPAGGDTWGDT